ncbi:MULTISPECIES: helix-turn-helix domain-containing protein [unclassified Rhizobium]|uniref:helix-turn-helix domain-containing protein n=1 Tax=unclassified Rhizobium TaxID=2613769 RepID=UPI000EA8C79A|nr:MULTISPECIES: helix-turn-helix domain-containing protein [unclassified Rhizobium]AYG69967.1 helix-turn-helix domain-containing protein [Rhizobium sp. CCGE531]AYG76343.1 helix-turn-helix domain-containing protein [Rhizobium sp. CCGE532]
MSKFRISAERGALFASQGDFMIEHHIADAMNAAHWHDHIELNYLLEGQMTYIFNGRQEQVEAGRLVLFWAAVPHRTIAVTPDAPLVCIYLPLVDFLGLPIDRSVRQSIMQGRFSADARAYAADAVLLPQWVEDWQFGDAARRRLIVDEVKLRIRRFVLDAPIGDHSTTRQSSASGASAAARRAEALTDIIHARYSEPVSLPMLAGLAGMHPSTANTIFRSILGIPVNEYLIRYRLARAMQQLAETETPILQIAYDCGFGSSSRFYDIFKRRTGTTPRLFRSSLGRDGKAD